MNIILIGYRATGKTSVGRSLASRLRIPFHDTDEIIMQTTGKTIRDLVDEGGWRLFRNEEKRAVACLSETDGCVVALGGGVLLDEDHAKHLGEKGLFIWLRADAGAIVDRMREDTNNGDQRPPLSGNDTGGEVRAMLRSREGAYRKAAHFAVDTSGRNIDEVSEEILRVLRSRFGLSGFLDSSADGMAGETA